MLQYLRQSGANLGSTGWATSSSAGQGRAGQGRAGQGRAGQCGAEGASLVVDERRALGHQLDVVAAEDELILYGARPLHLHAWAKHPTQAEVKCLIEESSACWPHATPDLLRCPTLQSR
jgi:hypothetical protein